MMEEKRHSQIKDRKNKENRRQRANELLKERATRSPQQQIRRLDAILGKGVGAVKERTRLQKQIEAEKAKKQEK